MTTFSGDSIRDSQDWSRSPAFNDILNNAIAGRANRQNTVLPQVRSVSPPVRSVSPPVRSESEQADARNSVLSQQRQLGSQRGWLPSDGRWGMPKNNFDTPNRFIDQGTVDRQRALLAKQASNQKWSQSRSFFDRSLQALQTGSLAPFSGWSLSVPSGTTIAKALIPGGFIPDVMRFGVGALANLMAPDIPDDATFEERAAILKRIRESTTKGSVVTGRNYSVRGTLPYEDSYYSSDGEDRVGALSSLGAQSPTTIAQIPTTIPTSSGLNFPPTAIKQLPLRGIDGIYHQYVSHEHSDTQPHPHPYGGSRVG